MKAYMGKVLWVDLTLGTWLEESIPDEIYKTYLGGIGLGAYLLTRDMPVGADPLGPENILGFMSGLLNGTGSLFSGRWMAVGKSPLTGTWGDANCGGTLAFAIKQCGVDAIFFKGISPKLVYFYMDAHGPQLLDATHLWGRDAIETEETLLVAHHGKKKPAVATIGQAGENLSLISGIVNDKGRMAARSGLGAVMGSKHLKAVVLAGAKRVTSHEPLKTRWLSWKCSRDVTLPLKLINAKFVALFGRIIGKLPAGFTQSGVLLGAILRKWGTIGTFPASIGMGDTPFKNWNGTIKDQPGVNRWIDADQVLRDEKHKYHCRGCPLGCGGIVELPQTKQLSHKPEYETAASFSTMLLNDDLGLVYEINEMLNRAGMDSISAGGSVAFAMECYDKGWITREETGGLELTWGNGPVIREVVRQMIAREGFGALLTDGSHRAALGLQPQALTASITAGGQEMAYHDPRLDPGMALHASVDPTPGRHTTGAQLYYDLYKLWARVPGLKPSKLFYAKESRYTPNGNRTRAAVAVSNFTQFYNSAGVCYMGMLIGVDRVPVFEYVNAATGWNLTPAEYMTIGQRIQTLRQMFNVREGIDPREIKVNKRLAGNPPMQAGPNKGVSFDLDAMMSAYWKEIGWDEKTGVPKMETIKALGLTGLVAPKPVGGIV